MTRRRIQRLLSCFVPSALLFVWRMVLSSAATFDYLKKLEIICFVPSYLPQGFQLKTVEITYDEIQKYEDQNHPLPLYSVEYGNDKGGHLFHRVGTRRHQRPKHHGGRGPEEMEIKANWVSDANMNAEIAKGPDSHPVLGRFHGFSATGMTVAELTKIVQSLHPVRPETPTSKPPVPLLRIHPKVFNMIDCRISDSESPVVMEINLDAVEKNGNQFDSDDVKPDGEWLRRRVPDTNGFMRYRAPSQKLTITRSNIRKTAVARSRQRPSSSSTLKNGTFAATESR